MKDRARLVAGIAQLTFVQAMRSRLWTAATVVGCVAIACGYVAAGASVWSKGRFIADTGLFAASVLGHVVALTLSTGMLSGEAHQQSEYMLLCRPLTRAQFLLGRLIGIGLVLFVLTQSMMVLTCLALLFTQSPMPHAFVSASLLLGLETLVTAALGSLFAAASSRPLATTLTVLMWLCGQAAEEVRLLAERKMDSMVGPSLALAYHLLPDFSRLSLRDIVAADVAATDVALYAASYALTYIAVAAALACVVYERRATRLSNA